MEPGPFITLPCGPKEEPIGTSALKFLNVGELDSATRRSVLMNGWAEPNRNGDVFYGAKPQEYEYSVRMQNAWDDLDKEIAQQLNAREQ